MSSDVYKRWVEYDKGIEYCREYDKNGNVIHYWNSGGAEWWSEYDEDGNVIHFRNSGGAEWWGKYDKDGHAIYFDRGDMQQTDNESVSSHESGNIQDAGDEYMHKLLTRLEEISQTSGEDKALDLLKRIENIKLIKQNRLNSSDLIIL